MRIKTKFKELKDLQKKKMLNRAWFGDVMRKGNTQWICEPRSNEDPAGGCLPTLYIITQWRYMEEMNLEG